MNPKEESEDARPTRFLARTKSFTRRSRGLPPNLEKSYTQFKDSYLVPVERGEGLTSVDPQFHLDPQVLFGRRAPLVVEVGSGRGEQIVQAAIANPDVDYLAFEVWLPGVARLVSVAGEAGIANIAVVEADAQQALKTLLAPGSADELWTFFPDPWRKSRHHKRRLVSADFATTAARLLKDEGIWALATDWENYAESMLEVIQNNPDFTNVYEGFAPRNPKRIITHFESKGREQGREIRDIVAMRKPRRP